MLGKSFSTNAVKSNLTKTYYIIRFCFGCAACNSRLAKKLFNPLSENGLFSVFLFLFGERVWFRYVCLVLGKRFFFLFLFFFSSYLILFIDIEECCRLSASLAESGVHWASLCSIFASKPFCHNFLWFLNIFFFHSHFSICAIFSLSFFSLFSLQNSLTIANDPGTSDDSGRASERLTTSSVAPRDADSSRDRLSDVSILELISSCYCSTPKQHFQ